MDTMNMKVKDLKRILEDIPDDTDVIMPVIDLDDTNYIFAFRHIRTAGILSNEYEDEPALCLNASENGWDISSQVDDMDTECVEVLF